MINDHHKKNMNEKKTVHIMSAISVNSDHGENEFD